MSKKNITIALFIIIFGVGLFVAIFNYSNQTSSQPSNTSNTSSNIKADGTYTFNQTYAVPRGDLEKFSSTVVIKDGVISSVKNTFENANNESKFYQSGFDNAIEDAVVGKKIDSLNISRVGGASLTTAAFLKGIKNI